VASESTEMKDVSPYVHLSLILPTTVTAPPGFYSTHMQDDRFVAIALQMAVRKLIATET